MEIGINGMAHVILSVGDFPRARAFYAKLLPAFGMEPMFDGPRLAYFVGARTAIGVQPAAATHQGERFEQGRVGLHHLCLRARSREDVDRCAALLWDMGATVVRAPAEGGWAPGYYSVLFVDPDGIRLEVNHVPGAGVLADGAAFDPTDSYAGGAGRAPPPRRIGDPIMSDPRTFTVFAGHPCAPDLPFKETLDPAVKRARTSRLHARAAGDAGAAAAVERQWRAQRAAWVDLLELCRWPPEEADAELASLERACDGAVRAAMERRPGLSLDGLLDALGRG